MIFATISAYAGQDKDPEKAMIVKADSLMVFGEGMADNPADADKAALANLLSKIGTTIDSRFNFSETENNVNGVIEGTTSVSNVVNTYSNATLTNTESLGYKGKDGKYYRLRYMKRSELVKMFARRQDRVEDYVRTAIRSEEKGRVDDALRYLNWAYLLLHSLQYPSGVKMTIDGREELLVNWIPEYMKGILAGVDMEVAGIGDDNAVDVLFTYKGEPAAGIDFTYWNGKVNSPINSAKDGMGQLVFPPDYLLQEITVGIETEYRDASRSDKELEMMMEHFTSPSFAAARKTVGIEGKKLKVDSHAKKEFQTLVTMGKREGVTPVDKKDAKDYDAIIADVLQSVKKKSFNPDSAYFTKEGLTMFDKLLRYGKASLIGEPAPAYYPFGERVVARSVPMKFSFNNNRSFVEDVTFTFSAEKKIESVAFGLGGAARKDIFEQGEGVWSDSIKMVIVTFLENYKTAFALKRLDYIKSIFDENAYIIVGHKLRKLDRIAGDSEGFSTVPKYEFMKKSKEEYITQLEKCFNSNEYVNINFSDNDVQKSAVGGDTFGIQIHQDYYSEHYGDQGYLYLFVDLNDSDKPVIKIRTWQPERDPELTPNLKKNNRDFGIYGNATFQ